MKILLSHGDGGTLTHQLIDKVFREAFGDEALDEQGDAAVLGTMTGTLAMSTDTFVINPLEFPGGDIGKLAVTGTVNDLAVSGAKPAYLSVGYILEEGLELKLLQRVVRSMAETARHAGVRIVAGDTKVVERGKCDQLFINTTGIGFIEQPDRIGLKHIQRGDRIIINGGIAEHAIAVLSQRAGIRFSTPVVSDCQPLNHMIEKMISEFPTIRFMRDPTRGGIATTLKEMAQSAGVSIQLHEEQIPIKNEIRGALELLGMDPYYMANEGKVLIIVSKQEAGRLVDFLRNSAGQNMAAEIGEVTEGPGKVFLRTVIGGTRQLDMMSGAPLPRIC